MLNSEKLSRICLDAAANASTSLTKLVGQLVTTEITSIKIAKVQTSFPEIEMDTKVASVCIPITGAIQGTSLLILPEETAYRVRDALLKPEIPGLKKLSPMDKSAIPEVGNIICGSFLTVFANETNIRFMEKVPSFSFDRFDAVVSSIIKTFAVSANKSLIIGVKFTISYTNFQGHIILFFGLEEFNTIIKALDISE